MEVPEGNRLALSKDRKHGSLLGRLLQESRMFLSLKLIHDEERMIEMPCSRTFVLFFFDHWLPKSFLGDDCLFSKDLFCSFEYFSSRYQIL